MNDWITDEHMPAAETLRRFAELQPETTVGPPLPTVVEWGSNVILTDCRFASR